MTRWQLQDAKARFSQVVKSAAQGPQEITVHGKRAAVILSAEEYSRLAEQTRPSFVDFVQQSPLRGAAVRIKRDRSLTRRARV